MDAVQQHTIRFQTLIPPDLYEQLQQLADEEGRSKSEVVRRAIRDRAEKATAA